MTPAVQEVVRQTAAELRVPAHSIVSPSKARHVVGARHEVIRRLRYDGGMSERAIGKALGLQQSAVNYVLNKTRERAGAASHRKQTARDFIDCPKQIRWLLNGMSISLASPSVLDRLRNLRWTELHRIPHERRREPNARRVPAEQRIDDIDAAILAARYVRRFGHGH